MGVHDKILQAKCRQLLEVHADTLDFLIKEIGSEVDGERIEGEEAFDYAKSVLRKQGIKEGLKLLQQRINKYAQ